MYRVQLYATLSAVEDSETDLGDPEPELMLSENVETICIKPWRTNTSYLPAP